MKKTIKSIIIGLALTMAANGQRGLTLDDINSLYENAVIEQANDLRTDIVSLQVNYVRALNAYRGKLLTSRNHDALVVITALNAEVKNIAAAGEGTIPPLGEGADAKIVSYRKTYEEQLVTLQNSSDKIINTLSETLVKQLETLKKSLVKSGDMRSALAIHERLIKLGADVADVPTDSSDPLSKKSLVIAKEFGGYASATSKQKLRLEEGAEYTLTLFAKLGNKELNEHDCLPRFSREEGETDFKGGDKNKMRIAQRLSEKRKVSNAGDGWSKITVKFTHSYNEPVVLGVVFYSSEDIDISLRDFTLTDSEGKNLITKKLNGTSGWEAGENVSFTK